MVVSELTGWGLYLPIRAGANCGSDCELKKRRPRPLPFWKRLCLRSLCHNITQSSALELYCLSVLFLLCLGSAL